MTGPDHEKQDHHSRGTDHDVHHFLTVCLSQAGRSAAFDRLELPFEPLHALYVCP